MAQVYSSLLALANDRKVTFFGFSVLNVNLTAGTASTATTKQQHQKKLELQDATTYPDSMTGSISGQREIPMELCSDFQWQLEGTCNNEPCKPLLSLLK